MGRFTKRMIVGLSAALALAGGAFADFLLDDFEGGSNENKMGNYWYVWVSDDGKVGEKMEYNAILSNAGPADAYGKWTFKPFEGESRGSGTKNSAALVWRDLAIADLQLDKIVEGWKDGGWSGTDPASLYPVVGMGSLLTEGDDIGYGADFAKVDAISFYMKGTAGAKVIFKVETIKNSVTGPYKPTQTIGPDKPNPANAYATIITVTEDWTKYTVPLKPVKAVATEGADIGGTGSGGRTGPASGADSTLNEGKGLYQLPWWGKAFTFKPEEVTKVAWQVNNDINDYKTGAVYVDSIVFVGSDFTFIPKDQCPTCVDKALPSGAKMLISDFESADPAANPGSLLENKLRYYWYPYTDEKARSDDSDPSTIDDYWTEDPYSGVVLDAKGHGNGGNGITVKYIPGKSPFIQTRGTVSQSLTAFAGIGTNLFDTSTNVFLNASGATGLYFEYKTEGVDFLTVEFPDKSDIDQAGPNGDQDDGQVWYKKIPGNNTSTWKGVIIPFNELSLPGWIKSSDRKGKNPAGTAWKQPHDLSKLAKIQFKYQGVQPGSIAIDNVYILGIEGAGEPGAIRTVGSVAKTIGLSATYSRGSVGVTWNAASAVAGGKIQLVNTKGRVVASAPIAKASGRVTASLNAGTIPTGMYFVRVNAKDVNGKNVVMQSPVSIVK